tara:strand:- start:556 stop:1206 length:651 start_codon:yes stop_codon:yes gene_type:complete
MVKIFGKKIHDLKYYWFEKFQLGEIELLISRTGWSSELGYEIFLLNASQGDKLYEEIMLIGEEMGLKPGHTSTIRRIEGGMLSYHADMDINTNPFELSLDRLIDLDKEFDFIGKEALIQIHNNGVERRQVGLTIEGEPFNGPNTQFWNVMDDNQVIGRVTSAVYSPRIKENIALAMLKIEYTSIGTEVKIDLGAKKVVACVTEKPFYDPKKSITKA